jgi:hypothetical protein
MFARTIAGRAWFAGTSGHLFVDGGDEPAARKAEALAREAASRPEVKASAIVSLFKGDGPAPVLWLADKGAGVVTSEAPPDAETGEALAAYLSDLQRRQSR